KKREGSLARRLTDNGNWHLKQPLCIVQARNVADTAGSEISQDPVIRSNQRNTEHEWDRELYPFAECCIAHIERDSISHSDARGTNCINQENSNERAGNGSIRQRGNTNAMRKQ